MTPELQLRRGYLFAFGAYFTWGLFPLYWPLLEPANAIEILASRMAWSLVVVLVLVWRLELAASVRAVVADRRKLGLLAVAAVAISVNWGVYIWAVNSSHVVEASLGYFITPLFTIVVGVLVLGERLRVAQWIAVGIASLAIVVIAVDYGKLPWIALTLGVSFTLYGLMKKQAAVGAVESLTIETGVLFVPALVAMGILALNSDLAFGRHGAGNAALLAGSGIVTVIPLLLFAGAARRLPLSAVGMMQYLTPIMQFLLGVLVDHEHMSASRWAGFVLVWFALTILTVDGLRSQRRARAPDPPAAAQPVRSSTV